MAVQPVRREPVVFQGAVRFRPPPAKPRRPWRLRRAKLPVVVRPLLFGESIAALSEDRLNFGLYFLLSFG
jgi:hypothetical protein